MRVFLDASILISALITRNTLQDRAYQARRDSQIEHLFCEKQIAEIRDITRRLTVSCLLRASESGHLANSIRAMAVWITRLLQVDIARNPNDDFLLALA